MKKLTTNLSLFAVLALVGWIFFRDRGGAPSQFLFNSLAPARDFFSASPCAAIVAFCFAHLFCSLLSLPGSCTFLNTVSGAVFGFWLGCTIVYPVTIVSACLMY